MTEIYKLNHLNLDLDDLYENFDDEALQQREDGPRKRKTAVRKEEQEDPPSPTDDDEALVDDDSVVSEQVNLSESGESSFPNANLEDDIVKKEVLHRQIVKYQVRVPHLLKGYSQKEWSNYMIMSCLDLEREIKLIRMVTRANVNVMNGRRLHNMLWQGIEYAGLQAKYQVPDIAQRIRLPENVRNLQEQMCDIVDLIDIEYGPDSPNLLMMYCMNSFNFFMDFHHQNETAVKKRNETLVAAAEASKFIPPDLELEAHNLLD